MSERLEFIPLGVYQHYKGKQYRVLGFAYSAKGHETVVLYHALYPVDDLDVAFGGKVTFMRTQRNFTENVVVDNQPVARFQFVA